MNIKKVLVGVGTAALLLGASALPALADKPTEVNSQGVETSWSPTSGCADIQSGSITDSSGNPLSVGFDQWGYNYQAHMFNGYYDNFTRPAVPVTSGDKLIMKWSDSWLANVDCDGDGKLDRGLVDGIPGGTSLGWLTNQLNGSYSDVNGLHDYNDFVKIAWTGVGSPLWGQYTVIQEVYNDPYGGYNGLLDKVGAPGFGLNDQWTTLP